MRVVQKFGGTSVASNARLALVADRVIETVRQGASVAVVVSAMAGETDRLLAHYRALCPADEAPVECDSLLAAGEQITAALLAALFRARGWTSRSFLGWQLPIHTSGDARKAWMLDVDTRPIQQCWLEGGIPVVAGFQGWHAPTGRITTLGRGGSDTTAVGLAAALHADRCDIFTDVDGVYSADPRLVPEARKLRAVGYQAMLSMASLGAKVLHPRSVQLAWRHGVRVCVRSSFSAEGGTWVLPDKDCVMLEDSTMVSLAYRRDQTLFLLEGWSSDAFHGALRGLAGASITMDWMAGAGALMVSLASHEGERALAVFRRHCPTDGAVECREGYAHLSMIGTASEAQPWMVEQCLEYIEVSGIPLAGWTASDVRLTLVLPEAYLTQALQGLHNRLLGASESGDRHASN